MPNRTPQESTLNYRGAVEFFFEAVGGSAREINRRNAKRDRTQFRVQITLATIDGRTRCVGVEMRSYERIDVEHGVVEPFGHRDGLAEISSSLWRSIPIGGLIERAIADRQADFKRLVEWARGLRNDQIDQEAIAREIESLIDDEPDRPRRGPQRLLSLEDLTTVVAPAYLGAGKKPVVAVRDALSKHRGEPVTMDQARKAVVRARAAGVLPPAPGRGKS